MTPEVREQTQQIERLEHLWKSGHPVIQQELRRAFNHWFVKEVSHARRRLQRLQSKSKRKSPDLKSGQQQ